MQRGRNNTVTAIPILIPCDCGEGKGVATFLPELRNAQHVRRFSQADLTKADRRMLKYERELFLASIRLMQALQQKDALAAGHARASLSRAVALKRQYDERVGITENDKDLSRIFVRYYGLKAGQEREAIDRWAGYAGGQGSSDDERWLLSRQVSQELASVSLVFWWSGTHFQPALYCRDLKTAPYVLFLMQRIAVCPFCGVPFTPRRPDQTYCSVAHREAHRVARWRAANLAKSQKKGGKRNVTRKTR
jgi:hypothetical protein